MFGLHDLVGCWKRENCTPFRLVPTDLWEDGPPLVVKTPTVIGRGSEAGTRLHDPWISRMHCELYEQDGMLMVRDLESRHGVYVNDQRVLHAALHAGDMLLLGVTRFRVDYDEPDLPSSPSAKREPEREPG
jgi:pSer/pThr/pTyr-binding forkhead associated (FHA) protein